ncbi:hypothetical protein [Cerasicoccus maritimus]|uniref:hypothetical protein n=1 Tax=Cerasicoccus maritimus TaxID=490089 RepID=UPI002852781D|nr:hypothetical protein [Cerasicoccus maritimus]
MSSNAIGIGGFIIFLCGVFLPFMGLEQNQSDALPLMMSGVCIIVGLGLLVQAIKPRLLKFYILGLCGLGICAGVLFVMSYATFQVHPTE